MKVLKKIPILRIILRWYTYIVRWYEYIVRLAPLNEFKDYDEYWKSRHADGHGARILDRYKIIASLIADRASILDIGCGDCAFQQYLLNNKIFCKTLGIDISPNAVSLAQEKGFSAQLIDPNVRLKNQILDNWDVVTLMEVIEHIPDAEELMRQVLEMRPTQIFVTIPNVGCLKHRLRLMFGGRFPITTIIYHMKEHLRFWTVKDFEQWADTFDLEIYSIHGQFAHGDKIAEWFTRKYPALFAAQIIYELRLKSE